MPKRQALQPSISVDRLAWSEFCKTARLLADILNQHAQSFGHMLPQEEASLLKRGRWALEDMNAQIEHLGLADAVEGFPKLEGGLRKRTAVENILLAASNLRCTGILNADTLSRNYLSEPARRLEKALAILRPKEPKRRSSEQRLTFDDPTQTISLDGRQYPVEDAKAYFIYKMIAEAEPGIRVKNQAIQSRIRGTKGRHVISKSLKLLPPALKKTLLTTTSGKCVRLPCLPQK
jgi:hypothetical protein